MALVWFKSTRDIIEEGGSLIEDIEEWGSNAFSFYDRRVSDTLTEEMAVMLRDSLGPYRTANNEIPQLNQPPQTFFIQEDDEGYFWHDAWVELYIPDVFKFKKG